MRSLFRLLGTHGCDAVEWKRFVTVRCRRNSPHISILFTQQGMCMGTHQAGKNEGFYFHHKGFLGVSRTNLDKVIDDVVFHPVAAAYNVGMREGFEELHLASDLNRSSDNSTVKK